MKSLEIRQRFITFFVNRRHQEVASSSLIPAQDPTLLFANAGMNQFKDVFLGKEQRSYKRAVSIQKCVRAGGKHNDLDNVGFTKRHLTFFEMMGNFSFGDYFKKEAITYAWEFLTKELHMPTEHLHATVYTTDDESYNLWHTMIGLPENKIHRLGEKENFWQMGDVGPCGPCTEIHLDRGPAFGCKDVTQCGPACDCDRFLEIWNLVFMQFDRQPDGTDKPLKQTGVDTGMGLERLSAVMQNCDSVFMTDLFTPIIRRTEELTGKKYAEQDHALKAAFHVLADHIRSTSMLIADGCAPSNDGRGYVLRKIIRRAALFTQKLTDKNIFPELSKVVVEQLGDIYPELRINATLIFSIVSSEIEKFAANLVRGKHILQTYMNDNQNTQVISGQQAFKLYDTFGFPTELIILIAQEHGFTVDTHGFDKEMTKQQEQSGKKVEAAAVQGLPDTLASTFTGYNELHTTGTITALVHHNQSVSSVTAGSRCFVIADRSPFFIVGGGQVPDQGWLTIHGHKTPILSVQYINDGIAAEIVAPENCAVGDSVTATVDPVWRTNAMKNHTATHMLQAALIELFGKHIKQSGSLVHPDYLRFDFTYHQNLSEEDIRRVENLVNEKIRANSVVNIEYMTMKEATKRGALAFFGDKYNPEEVRMVEIPGFSTELCGGTHVHTTGEIGTFKITEVTALSAGHRRIFAVSGPKAIELFQNTFGSVKALSQEFKVKTDDVIDAVHKQLLATKALHTQLKQLKKNLAKAQLPLWEKQIEIVNTIPFACLHIDNFVIDDLKDVATQLQAKKAGLYIVSSVHDEKGIFVCSVAPELAERFSLKVLSAWLKNHGLQGGGSKTMIQGGGAIIDTQLCVALREWVAHV